MTTITKMTTRTTLDSQPDQHSLVRVIHGGLHYGVAKSQLTGRQMSQVLSQEVRVPLVRVSVPVPVANLRLRAPPPNTSQPTKAKLEAMTCQPNHQVNNSGLQTKDIKHIKHEKEVIKELDTDCCAKRKLRSNSVISNALDTKNKKFKSLTSNNKSKDVAFSAKNDAKSRKKNKENRNKCNAQLSRVIGLPNMGNTCYINSIVQGLSPLTT